MAYGASTWSSRSSQSGGSKKPPPISAGMMFPKSKIEKRNKLSLANSRTNTAQPGTRFATRILRGDPERRAVPGKGREQRPASFEAHRRLRHHERAAGRNN